MVLYLYSLDYFISQVILLLNWSEETLKQFFEPQYGISVDMGER